MSYRVDGVERPKFDFLTDSSGRPTPPSSRANADGSGPRGPTRCAPRARRPPRAATRCAAPGPPHGVAMPAPPLRRVQGPVEARLVAERPERVVRRDDGHAARYYGVVLALRRRRVALGARTKIRQEHGGLARQGRDAPPKSVFVLYLDRPVPEDKGLVADAAAAPRRVLKLALDGLAHGHAAVVARAEVRG